MSETTVPVRESAVQRAATVLIAVVIGTAALWWLRGILTPLILAVFLAIMVDGLARLLRSRVKGLNERTAVGIAVVGILLVFGLVVYIIADNGSAFVTRVIGYGPRINGLLERFGGMLNIPVPPTVDQLVAQLNPTRYLGTVAHSLQGVLEQAVFVLIYMGFLIASRRGFERKMVRLFSNRGARHDAMEVFERIRDGVESYLLIQTVTGLMVAGASFVLMAIVGLDNALFWAFLIFFLCYIPIVGGAVGIAVPPIFALVQFETFWQAGLLLIVLWSVHFFVGNVILPKMQGDSMNIDPIVVLLSLGFWGALWGVTGMFLSTPLTVMVMVILAQFDGSRWIAVLLSHTGDPLEIKEPPTPAEALDQRSAPAHGPAAN